MFDGQMVFPQLIEYLPRHVFNECVERYEGDRRVRELSCRDQFLAMAFAQITSRGSLREVTACLDAMRPKLYHAGFRGRVRRATLADANCIRDWRIWRDLGLALIDEARRLHAGDPLPVELKNPVFALDATVFDLSLTLFPWTPSQRDKAAVKLHVLLDLRGKIPSFLRVSGARTRDCSMLDEVPIEPGAFYLMDRDYNDYQRLHRVHQAGAFFVVRGKRNLTFKRRKSHPVDRSTGLRCDQTVVFQDPRTRRKYPDRLRRVGFYKVETRRPFVFITNHFSLSASTVVALYWQRWEVELFFKWIKQHLRLTHFLGNSPNAVRTQIWIATCVYLLVSLLKRTLQIDRPASEILHILSIALFEKTPINTLLSPEIHQTPPPLDSNQLRLFDL